MEVHATRCWAEEMNKRDCQIDIHTIRKNPEPYPDCLAEMDGKKIGVEVIELVCREAIEAYPENPQYEGPEQFLREFSIPMPPKWPLDKFQKKLNEIVQKKDKRVRDSSLSKQFLLIVTDEPYLVYDAATLFEYLKTIQLQRPRHFDGIYVMGSYGPDGEGHGHHPVCEVPLAG